MNGRDVSARPFRRTVWSSTQRWLCAPQQTPFVL